MINRRAVIGAGTAALAAAVFSPARAQSKIDPDTLIVGPRLYGMAGEELNLYFANLRIGQGPQIWRAGSPDLPLAKQFNERWTYTPPSGHRPSAVTIECLNPDSLSVATA